MKGSTKYWTANENGRRIVRNVKTGGALGDESQCGQGFKGDMSSSKSESYCKLELILSALRAAIGLNLGIL